MQRALGTLPGCKMGFWIWQSAAKLPSGCRLRSVFILFMYLHLCAGMCPELKGGEKLAQLWACCSSASGKTLFCPQTFPHTSWQPCHLHLSKAENFQPSWGSTHGRSLYCVHMDNACWPKMALCSKRSEKAEHGKRKDYYAYFREWDLKPEEWQNYRGRLSRSRNWIFRPSFGFYPQGWPLSRSFPVKPHKTLHRLLCLIISKKHQQPLGL